jgi:hypothetical protein
MSGNIQVSGDGSAQTLQAPGDFKVTATFPKTASSSAAAPITLNASVSVPGPGGIPAYGAADKPKNGLFGKVGHHTQSPAVLYVTFESDKGATFTNLPVIDVVIPLSVLEAYGTDPTIGIAIYDPANENKWTKDIAQTINATPTPTPSGGVKATPTPTPTPTQTPTPTPTPSGSPTPRPPGAPAPTPTVSTTPTVAATPRGPVPSMEVRFVPTQRAMKLLAKKSLSFVVYAEPANTPTPEATASAKANSSARPSASGTAAASPSALASPGASATAAAATSEPTASAAAASAAPSASP